MMLQIKTNAGTDSTVRGFAILPLDGAGNGIPGLIRINLAQSGDMSLGRSFILSTPTKISYGVTGDPDPQILSAYVR